MSKMKSPETIDDYIARFPDNIQTILRSIRATVRKAAPNAEETIKYGMPTFVFHGNLVHFAVFKRHIGFYPAPMGIAEFKKEVARYGAAKSTLQFPLDAPMPLVFIRKYVKFRVKRNTSGSIT